MTDNCPSCCREGIAPSATAHRRGRIVHGYECPSCGHTWATTRDLTAYSELHARAASTRGHRAARNAS